MALTSEPSRPPPTPFLDGRGNISVPWALFLARQAAAMADAGYVVGDYRETASDLSADSAWLHCDGADASDITYPALSAIIKPILGAGGGANTFRMPTIADFYNTIGDPMPVRRTWVKAL